MTTRSTPLLATHRALGARLTDFAGWDMPLQFSGVIAEHNAVRSACGVFDVSHLGKLLVPGDGAALGHALTADPISLEPGRARYALCLADDGGVIDDVFVYRLAPEEWLVVPNAANVGAVAASIEASGGEPRDAWDRWAILAVQGPQAFEVFEKALPGLGDPDMALHSVRAADGGLLARTGYTGEPGYEYYVPAAVAPEAFSALLDAGAVPCGLGCRDTLRLEMGYALYDHELERDVNPLEANLSWAIAWDTDFRGKEALERVRAAGPARKLVGIVCRDRGVPRDGCPVLAGGEAIGVVASGNHSPVLGTGIATAFVVAEEKPEEGSEVAIEVRGRLIRGDIVKPPFIRR